MRKSLKLLAVATLLLPGCILVTKDGGWDSDSDRHGKSSLEQRVAALEAQIRYCQEEAGKSACKCMAAEKAHGDAGAEHAAPSGAH